MNDGAHCPRGRLTGRQLLQEGLEVLGPDPYGVLEAVGELVGR